MYKNMVAFIILFIEYNVFICFEHELDFKEVQMINL
jgi:hypothetical protein